MSQVSPRIASHLDFQGLGELKGQAQRQDSGALREVAQQFEAMFIQQIMKTMREAGFKGGELIESQAMDTFQSMHDKEISLQMAKRGSFGLADMLVRSMEQQQKAIPAAEALAARANAQGNTNGGGLEVKSLQQRGLPVERPAVARALKSDTPAFGLPRKSEGGMTLQRELLLPGMLPVRTKRGSE
jgi:Rod binding domain-containing protein